MSASFFTQVPGKWVLTGEHAVLTGARAIALQHPEYMLSFSFEPQAPLAFEGVHILPPSLESGIKKVLDRAQDLLQKPPLTGLSGTVHVESTIPFGAGLGSSAALCVAITRWLISIGHLTQDQEQDFAKKLEDTFHGRSSGMDVAAVAAQKPILFSRAGGARVLDSEASARLKALPFKFIDTGLRAPTRDCVEAVQALRQRHPYQGRELDAQMARATELVMAALMVKPEAGDYGADHGLVVAVIKAMQLGQRCYREWGLVPASVAKLEAELIQKGARAVKLTGAGAGGFLVTL